MNKEQIKNKNVMNVACIMIISLIIVCWISTELTKWFVPVLDKTVIFDAFYAQHRFLSMSNQKKRQELIWSK